MADKKLVQPTDPQAQVPTTPLRCIIGALISGALTYGLYSLMVGIVTTYANKPIASNSQLAANIASAVRTLVIGVTALGTGVFGIVTIGLLALAVQLVVQKQTGKQN
ncbi:DUF3082 domain-containing protein [Scytonema sp. UIC 10036]|uniref:DUF3082 domain-containing protein n=1 Tax=Scytonema sp. UIC 10036 TaxID=2304196 RepID=UPI0012DA92EB|nr:DUF3082 domain-containing protein [Scytonema sp. UIC 10036]MUG94404.1 DUF3082 domain-containing protein [Scytonema sp. UIC 10036]